MVVSGRFCGNRRSRRLVANHCGCCHGVRNSVPFEADGRRFAMRSGSALLDVYSSVRPGRLGGTVWRRSATDRIAPYAPPIVDRGRPSALGGTNDGACFQCPRRRRIVETAMPLVAPETAPSAPTNVSKVANIPNLRPRRSDPWRAVGGSLYLAWIIGTVFLLLRLLHGIYGLARLRRGAVAAQPATNDGRVRRRPSCAWRRGIAADSDLACSRRDRPRPAYFFRAFCCRKGWSMHSTTGNSATC